MLSSNGNQYLRPEYLNPLPTTVINRNSLVSEFKSFELILLKCNPLQN